jgi:hypothetical protein
MLGTNIKSGQVFRDQHGPHGHHDLHVICDVISCIGCMLMVSTMSSAKADYGNVLRDALHPDPGAGRRAAGRRHGQGVRRAAGDRDHSDHRLRRQHVLGAEFHITPALIWGGLLLVVLILSTRMSGDGFFKIHREKKVKEPKKVA